jgi:hypothetical protein
MEHEKASGFRKKTTGTITIVAIKKPTKPNAQEIVIFDLRLSGSVKCAPPIPSLYFMRSLKEDAGPAHPAGYLKYRISTFVSLLINIFRKEHRACLTHRKAERRSLN